MSVSMHKYPWSSKQLRRLGESIREGAAAPERSPEYADVMSYFNDYAATIQQAIYELDWESLLQGRAYEVTSRPKTIDTLRQKLRRDHNTPLQNIQDIAGIRFEAGMTLKEQDVVVGALAAMFDVKDSVIVRDLRDDPHSGYRAVHLWLREPARAEIQVRTHLQGKWANMYEAAADVLGRDIRYGKVPEDRAKREVVKSLHEISNDIAFLENKRTEFEEKDLAMFPRAPLAYRGRRMRKSDVRRMNHERWLYQEHENMRMILSTLEAQIASGCDRIKTYFESNLESGGE